MLTLQLKVPSSTTWLLASLTLVVIAAVLLRLLSHGPSSFRAQYKREVAQGVSRGSATALLTDADIAALPVIVQRYIRLSGAVGQPHVQNFRARFHGQIRSGPEARWMSLTGEQYNFFDKPSRFFLMDASRRTHRLCR